MTAGLKKHYFRIAAALLLSLSLLIVLFYGLLLQYQENSLYGSAVHLIEINRQVKADITSLLERDRNVVRDITEQIYGGGVSSKEELLRSIDFHRTNWKEDGIEIYTGDGRCIVSGRTGQNSDSASAFAAQVSEEGSLFRIVDSEARYAEAVDTDLTVDGSRVVAVAVVHDLGSLLDDLGLTSFDGAGSLYLVRQSGVEISRSGGDNARNVYNLLSSFDAGTIENLTGSGLSMEETMDRGEEGAYLFTGADRQPQYIILTPVRFMDSALYLFNIVPRTAVNATMTQFTHSVIILLIVVVLLILLFFIFYLRRADLYNRQIAARERLFDILVSETKNGFILLKAGSRKPDYVSSNMKDIFHGDSLYLESSGEGYRLTGNGSGAGQEITENINTALKKWNGVSEFVSDYLPYSAQGQKRYLRLHLYPVSGQKNEFVGIVQDMTKDFIRENNLREAMRIADSANQAKSRFLSSISHDIRTPLNAILNMTRFLQEEITDPEESGQLEIVRQSSEHLLELINNVLDISRIESGKLSFAHEAFDLSRLIDSTVEMIQPLCDGKKQKLVVSEKIQHTAVTGDALRVSQILLNLLNNAVKYTADGGTIEFQTEELDSIKQGAIPFRFTVRDNGMGISQDRLEDIFQPFSRVENKTVRATEGNGLGLAITKSIVDAMGGRISVQSRVGEGSVFTVEVPFASGGTETVQKAMHADTEKIRFDGRRALLAEDNEINAAIAVTLLERRGMAVETAADGREALELFRTRAAGCFDLIYMDIQMPVMDGYEAAAALRSMEREDAKTIPVIAMTANAFAEDVERARAAGMNAHVSKPIDPDELYRTTAEVLAKQA
jgi:signal transduction histidine kinase/ActR/RegA family two-component response regulator